MRHRLSAVPAALIAGLAVGAPPALAKTYLVSTTADTEPAVPNPACAAPCSLRQAIQDANEAGEAENVVQLPPGGYGLAYGSLRLIPKAGVERIVGLGARAGEVEIKGETSGNAASVLSVGTGAGAVPEVELTGVKITGSRSNVPGGAIDVHEGDTLLADVDIQGNTAHEEGGGIEIGEGRLSVADSLITDNAAEGTPGTGGGIDVKGGSVTLTDDTIAGNTAARAGGGIYDLGKLQVNGATIAGNEAGVGGGLAGRNSAELVNTLLALNGNKDCSGIAIADPLGHNLADDGSCPLEQAGDKPDVDAGLDLLQGAPKPTPLLADNGGFTETIALQAGSAALAAGSEAACLAADQRGVARPSKLCDIGAFQLSQELPNPSPNNPNPSTTQPPPTGSPPPPPTPVLAQTGNVGPVSGVVLVELPGTHTFVALTTLRSVPFGTVIDATHGRVLVTTAGSHGGTQTGEFFDGELVLTQSRDGEVQAALAGGDFAACPKAGRPGHGAPARRRGRGASARRRGRGAATAGHRSRAVSPGWRPGRALAASSAKHPVRKLWSDAHGSFSTKGNYAAGAVQGTEWLTEDFCDGTLVRVTRDKVLVTDLVNHRHYLVRVGHSRFVRAPAR